MINQRGFTLAELIVAIAVVGLIMAGLVTLQQSGQSAYLQAAGRVETQQNSRVALDLMTRELRQATTITADPACNVGATTITFTDTATPANVITYQLAGTTLNRNGAALIGGVQTFTIQCLDGNSVATNVSASVRMVTISLTTGTEDSVASYSMENQHSIVSSQVRLRNIL